MKIVDLNDEWALNIGKVFLSFGCLEKLTIDCINKWLDGQRIVNHLVNGPLNQRVNIVIDLAKDKYGDCEEFQSFSKHLKSLQELGKQRNLIAHNPLMIVFYEDSFEEKICSLRNDDVTFTLSELHQFVLNSEVLYQELLTDLVKFKILDSPNYMNMKLLEGLHGLEKV
ncbi:MULTISPECIES: hypothetical protein [unclassified Shewanella]|uniref:hypothetical protein n=1 Tax=unclassified Shewanella TaxID=196818 RepID=UPI00156A44EE|nr:MULTISPECIES: hypothetical protein [unclassified Shewanella]MCU8008486.1 hypothetical protein [Shewanella sp. SM87]